MALGNAKSVSSPSSLRSQRSPSTRSTQILSSDRAIESCKFFLNRPKSLSDNPDNGDRDIHDQHNDQHNNSIKLLDQPSTIESNNQIYLKMLIPSRTTTGEHVELLHGLRL